MGLYQSVIIFILVFLGEYFIPENSDYQPNRNGEFVTPGRAFKWNGDDLYKELRDGDNDPGPSRHFTVVFNTFVFMQIFNMINARKINDELNIFEGIHHNSAFMIIFVLITVIQIFIIQFTQDVFQVARDGLAWHQWMLCIAISLTVFPVNFITKFVPEKWFPEIGKKKRNPLENSGSLNFRKNRKLTMTFRQPQLSLR